MRRALSIVAVCVLALVVFAYATDRGPFKPSVVDLVSDSAGFRLDRCTRVGLAVVAGEREAVYRCWVRSKGKDWFRCYSVVDGRAYPVAEQARGLGCL